MEYVRNSRVGPDLLSARAHLRQCFRLSCGTKLVIVVVGPIGVATPSSGVRGRKSKFLVFWRFVLTGAFLLVGCFVLASVSAWASEARSIVLYCLF